MSDRRNQVFISYSHKDREWLEKLQTMLKPLVRKQKISVWDDTHINPGAQRKEEISKALDTADVAVLLVSANFLASDFIAQYERPKLLSAAKQKGLKILWIYLSDCLYEDTEIVNYQPAHDTPRSVKSLMEAEQEEVFKSISQKIQVVIRHLQKLGFRSDRIKVSSSFAERSIDSTRPIKLNPQPYQSASALDPEPKRKPLIAKEIDYTQLRNLLAASEWEKADEKTAMMMLQVAGREKQGYLTIEDIEKFPCGFLQKIDELWSNYSGRKFGFSVQKKSWMRLGGGVDYKSEAYLGTHLDWRQNGGWKDYSKLIFNLEEAPQGHLPGFFLSEFCWRSDAFWCCLLKRFEDCPV